MRYFVAFGELLHCGPPLSRQTAALEAELGVTLVLRRPRAIVLTAAGHGFLGECLLILARSIMPAPRPGV